jgi:hypothetical protein
MLLRESGLSCGPGTRQANVSRASRSALDGNVPFHIRPHTSSSPARATNSSTVYPRITSRPLSPSTFAEHLGGRNEHDIADRDQISAFQPIRMNCSRSDDADHMTSPAPPFIT